MTSVTSVSPRTYLTKPPAKHMRSRDSRPLRPKQPLSLARILSKHTATNWSQYVSNLIESRILELPFTPLLSSPSSQSRLQDATVDRKGFNASHTRTSHLSYRSGHRRRRTQRGTGVACPESAGLPIPDLPGSSASSSPAGPVSSRTRPAGPIHAGSERPGSELSGSGSSGTISSGSRRSGLPGRGPAAIQSNVAPPAIPTYDQPEIPVTATSGRPATGPGVAAATTGSTARGFFLPTPELSGPPATGAMRTGFYGWYPGYWGLNVGYYGGINYGFGLLRRWLLRRLLERRPLLVQPRLRPLRRTASAAASITVTYAGFNGHPGGVWRTRRGGTTVTRGGYAGGFNGGCTRRLQRRRPRWLQSFGGGRTRLRHTTAPHAPQAATSAAASTALTAAATTVVAAVVPQAEATTAAVRRSSQRWRTCQLRRWWRSIPL